MVSLVPEHMSHMLTVIPRTFLTPTLVGEEVEVSVSPHVQLWSVSASVDLMSELIIALIVT